MYFISTLYKIKHVEAKS